MTPDWTIDVRIAPDGALSRISSAINRRPKRTFGVLKTENEYVGLVGHGAFEIWERHQHAIHALGRIEPLHGGSRIELRFVLPARTRVLIVVFFALYAVAAGGIATRNPEPALSAQEFAIAVAGALVLAGGFAVAALRQRAHLRAFLERLFSDLPLA